MALKKLAKKLLNIADRYETYNLIELSKDALISNLRFFESQNPNHTIIPVIKGNAYGHGIKEIAMILNSAELDLIAVDGYFEATAIKSTTKHRILVMGAIKPTNVRLLDTKKCSFVVQDVETLKAFGKLKKNVNIHMELNTGMQRLGLGESEIEEYLRTLSHYPNLKLEGVMSHLADADNRENIFTEKQSELFNIMLNRVKHHGFTPKYIHLAQTAGSTKSNTPNTNALRIGIGLYGINPLSPSDPKYPNLDSLKPVMELKSTIIKVQKLQRGDKVSYNGTFTATKPMRVGVLPLGYYEGYPRDLSNRGITLYENKPLKVVGRVCMNHTMIDLSESDADVGSGITLISSDKLAPNSVANICKTYGLFPYQLVTGLSEKIKRSVI